MSVPGVVSVSSSIGDEAGVRFLWSVFVWICFTAVTAFLGVDGGGGFGGG